MKIALAQLNYHVGNFEQNTNKIIHSIKKAKLSGCDLIVFSELAICGYPPRDFLEFTDFIERCYQSAETIALECIDIAAIIGMPTRNNLGKGKALFNSAAFLFEGKIQSIHNKSLLPNYDIFDEYRYFEPDYNSHILNYKNLKIAITICEDLWNIGEEQLYPYSPMEKLIAGNPDLMINIAASPFNVNQAETRKNILKKNVEKYKIPLFYVNHAGAQTELIFDGGSMALNSDGEIISELNYFEEDFRIFDTNNLTKNNNLSAILSRTALIHDALITGIKDYFQNHSRINAS